jgi:hypothetical protein
MIKKKEKVNNCFQNNKRKKKRMNESKENIYSLLFVVYIYIHVVCVYECVTKKTDYLPKKNGLQINPTSFFFFILSYCSPSRLLRYIRRISSTGARHIGHLIPVVEVVSRRFNPHR